MTSPSLCLAVAATGSMGDVRPVLLLAAALAQAGHRVRCLAPPQYAELVAEFGLSDFRPIWLDREEMIRAQALSNDERSNHLDEAYFDRWFACYPAIREACRDVDGVIARYAVLQGFAKLAGVPFFHVSNVPPLERPGRTLPRVVAGTRIARLDAAQRQATRLTGSPGLVNLATHLQGLALSPLQAWRGRAGLRVLAALPRRQRAALEALAETPEERARLASRQAPPTVRLYGLSAALVPTARAAADEVYTGLWHVEPPAGYRPPEALKHFLEAGPPPVFLGFGSNPCTRAGRGFDWISEVVAAAVERVGCRVLLQGGWGGLRWPEGRASAPDQVLEIGDVPHEWLFKQVSAAVHHGGAGTSLEALRQGLPSVVVPFVNDQFFWAWRLFSLGVAPPPFEADAMTPVRLEAALRQVLEDGALRGRAEALAAALRQEDGLAAAVQAIESRIAAGSATAA